MLDITAWVLFACVVLGALGFCFMVADEDSRFFGIIGAVMVFCIAIFAGSALYDELYYDHPAFELRKSEWVCSAAHDDPVTTYIQVGQVMVPNTIHQQVCDAYGRRP